MSCGAHGRARLPLNGSRKSGQFLSAHKHTRNAMRRDPLRVHSVTETKLD